MARALFRLAAFLALLPPLPFTRALAICDLLTFVEAWLAPAKPNPRTSASAKVRIFIFLVYCAILVNHKYIFRKLRAVIARQIQAPPFQNASTEDPSCRGRPAR